MKKDRDLRITIIGLGNLMEAIFPCIVETIGRENLHAQWKQILSAKVTKAAHTVRKHGMTLSG
jgi:hypothetical protein